MNLIRLQEKVPYIYVEKSRDFQLLCRAYDTALNQVKFDIDTMPYILSSAECRNSVLPLLQTKLGFQTNLKLDSASLRLILDAFPKMLRNKGSLTGIMMAVNVWLKIIELETQVYVDIFNILDGPYSGNDIGGYIGQIEIPKYTIAIGISGNPRDYSILQEILKYIIPTGYRLYFYFFKPISTEDTPTLNPLDDQATLVHVSDDVNAVVRNDLDETTSHETMTISQAGAATRGQVVGAVFSTSVIKDEDPENVSTNELYVTRSGGIMFIVEVTNSGTDVTFDISNVSFSSPSASLSSLEIMYGLEPTLEDYSSEIITTPTVDNHYVYTLEDVPGNTGIYWKVILTDTEGKVSDDEGYILTKIIEPVVTASVVPSRTSAQVQYSTQLAEGALFRSGELKYGTTISYGNTVTLDSASGVVDLSGLDPNTRYYYKITIKDNSNREGAWDLKRFITTGNNPVVTVNTASISNNSVTISYNISCDTNSSYDSGYVEISPGAKKYALPTNPTSSISVYNLNSNTTYSYKLVVKDNKGHETTTNSYTFRTTSNAPVIKSVAISSHSTGGATYQVMFTPNVQYDNTSLAYFSVSLDGESSVRITSAQFSRNLLPGEHRIVMTVTDTAGRSSSQYTRTFVV